MTNHFGIRPWDVERMTYDELLFYREALRDLTREQRRKPSTSRSPTRGRRRGKRR